MLPLVLTTAGTLHSLRSILRSAGCALGGQPSSRKILRKGRGRIGQSLWSSYGPLIVSRGAKTVPLQIDLFLFNSETNILADGKGGLSVALKIVVQIAAIKAVGPSLQRANDLRFRRFRFRDERQ
jgi:hypothetical protein